jgi:hypothetical protein
MKENKENTAERRARLGTLAYGHHEDRTPGARLRADTRGRDGGVAKGDEADHAIRIGIFDEVAKIAKPTGSKL